MTFLILPAIISVAASLTAALFHRQIRPALAVPVLTFLTTTSAITVLSSLTLLVFGFVGHIAWVAERFAWCRDLAHSHEEVSTPIGLTATAALSVAVLSMVRNERRRPRTNRSPVVDSELVVLPGSHATAYAVPGNPGHIVVSAGMLRALDDQERRVLLAHERAHLRHKHHRYLRLSELSATSVPLLRPVSKRIRFATERWADEVAASAVGDRRLAARAIARAALATTPGPSPALAMAALGVPARVNALLEDSSARSHVGTATIGLTAIALLAVGGSTVQFHHLLAFAESLCG